MLQKETRARLLKRNWLDAMEEGSNSSGRQIRLKRRARTALEDLTLLAAKMPDGELEEVFTPIAIRRLLMVLLKVDAQQLNDELIKEEKRAIELCLLSRTLSSFYTKSGSGNVLDPYGTRLASLIAEYGITKCIEQYDMIESELSGPLTHQLFQSSEYCLRIANRIERYAPLDSAEPMK